MNQKLQTLKVPSKHRTRPPSRDPSRSGVDCGIPLIAYSGERPRNVSPAPDSFCRVGEKDGVRLETASTTYPPIATCWSSAARSITSIVSGSALGGRMLRVCEQSFCKRSMSENAGSLEAERVRHAAVAVW